LVDQIQNGTLTLSTNSSLLTVQNSTINFDALSVQDSTMVTGVFSVLVGNGFADLTAVPVILTAAYDGNVSQTTYNVVLHAPILHVINYQIDNEGSPILPGDNPSFYITIENTGTGRASGVVLLWMNDNAYITLGTQETLVSSIAPGAQLVAQQPLNITVSPDTPIGQTLTINYYLGCENGEGSDGNLAFYVGMLNYTFEQNLDNWTHEAFNAEFTDQWHRESVRSYDGGWSVKFGGNGFVDYSNHAYGAFVSPEIALGQNARLKFFHYIDAEVSSGSAGMAWDGGIVEMSLNGGSWIQITPDSGYPYLCVDNSESPFAANTPMFSGLQDWQEETFSLADHSGNARFRFVFGSDGGVTGEGWYLDNIRVEMDYTAAQDDIIPSSVTLCENFPNPFNPHTTLRFALPAKDKISLEIYNVKGQLVKTLIRQTEFSAGTHSLVWDGTDNQQQSVSSGMYMYRLHSSKSSLSRKMLLLK
jgi:hypothetical protein